MNYYRKNNIRFAEPVALTAESVSEGFFNIPSNQKLQVVQLIIGPIDNIGPIGLIGPITPIGPI